MGTILRVGQWALARRILGSGSRRAHAAMDMAVQQEAHFLRRMVVEGLREQAPGGQRFKELAPSTIATRNYRGFRGTKALLVRGDLRNSIVVQRRRWGEAFVGVLRTARGPSGQLLANIAELNENGSRPIVIQLTPKMKAFLGMIGADGGGDGGGEGGGGGSGRPGFVVVQIPARPFFRPVVEMYFGDRTEVQRRFLARIGVLMDGDFGQVGGVIPPTGVPMRAIPMGAASTVRLASGRTRGGGSGEGFASRILFGTSTLGRGAGGRFTTVRTGGLLGRFRR